MIAVSSRRPIVDGKKLCTSCLEMVPVEQFNTRGKKSHLLQSHCRKCQTSNHKDRFELLSPEEKALHYALRYQYARDRIARIREIINELKSKPCMDCRGSFPPVCMDFDHARGEKFYEVSKMVVFSFERILEEIKKCDLVCSNCHRLRTAFRKELAADSDSGYGETIEATG